METEVEFWSRDSALRIRGQCKDEGYLHERTNWNPHEAVLAEDWAKVADPNSYVGLDALIGSPASERDHFVAASVIQWLGTNVGFSFLQHAFSRVGYTIHGSMPLSALSAANDPLLEKMEEVIALSEASSRAWQLLFDLSEAH